MQAHGAIHNHPRGAASGVRDAGAVMAKGVEEEAGCYRRGGRPGCRERRGTVSEGAKGKRRAE